MVWIWHLMPSAYQGGLSSRFGVPQNIAAYWAVCFALPLIAFSLIDLGFWQVVMGCVVSAALVWGLSAVAWQKIKGITGDVLGSAQQLGSIGFLLGALAL